MYAIELAPEFGRQVDALHPRRFKQIYLRVFALQANPRPPDCIMLDTERCIVRIGPYAILYKVDDSRQIVQPLSLEETD